MGLKLTRTKGIDLRARLIGDKTRAILIISHPQEPDDRAEFAITGADCRSLMAWLDRVTNDAARMDANEPETLPLPFEPVETT